MPHALFQGMGHDRKKRSQNAQPQNEILRSKGVGGAALNKQFVAMDSHKHCLLL